MIATRLTVAYCVAVLALIATGCRPAVPVTSIDPALASRVPPSAVALAFADLDQLRAAYPKLRALPDAHTLIIASNGSALLTISRAADISVLGAPDLIAAANAPHPPAAILKLAEPVAAHHPIWIAIRGGTPLPLTGNLANANNFLPLAESVTVTATLRDAAIDVELVAKCPAPAAALQFEQRLRALLSLTAAASHLPRAEIRRDDRTVTARLSAPPALIQLLLEP